MERGGEFYVGRGAIDFLKDYYGFFLSLVQFAKIVLGSCIVEKTYTGGSSRREIMIFPHLLSSYVVLCSSCLSFCKNLYSSKCDENGGHDGVLAQP